MPFLIVSLLAIFAIVMVAYPFFRRSGPAVPQTPDVRERRRREEIYQEIRALQMEFQLGTLEEAEFRRQLQLCRMEAARSIRDEELSLLDRELEQRIFSSRVSAIREASPAHPRSGNGETASAPGAGGTQGHDADAP